MLIRILSESFTESQLILNIGNLSMNTANLLLIGCGPHAKRIYFPILDKLGQTLSTKIVAIVDLVEKEQDIKSYLKAWSNQPELIFLKPEEVTYDFINASVATKLNRLVKQYSIEGVIIATEPISHVVYARWALSQELNILMDKPVSTVPNVSTDLCAAQSLTNDYDDLLRRLIVAREKNPHLIFNLMTQRRYHPAFSKIRYLLKEVFERTQCPITSIQSYHGDGQWRTPSELIDINYHNYNQGYGKCCHSGYHTIDIANWLVESIPTAAHKAIDEIEVFAQLSRPLDNIAQLTPEDYRRIFPEYDKYNHYSDDQLQHRMIHYGEVDAFTSLAYKSAGRTITLASVNMLHNSFSQRHQSHSMGRDLYKGNGRVRHESHYICQGPFQSIAFTSYQSQEIGQLEDPSLYNVGGEYHLDIHIFRNDKLFSDWENHTLYTLKDLSDQSLEGYSRGHQEDARMAAILEFILQLRNPTLLSLSPLESHRHSVQILSGIYQSSIKQVHNEYPLIKIGL